MRNVIDYQQIIADSIVEFKKGNGSNRLFEPVNYILDLGGKRLRPALLLMTNDLFGGDIDDAINCALAVEVFHNFTLLHDDIMDSAPIRRGSPTVHEKWGVNEAILSGDVMMVQAVQLMTQCPDRVLRKVLDIFHTTAVEVCVGQQMDMDFEKRNDVSIPEYIKMVELKTAVLLAGAMKIGAIIGGASDEDADRIYEFGRNLGISFQIMDDILDVYGDQDKFGKQVGGDIIENKKTFLMLKALEMTNGSGECTLNDWMEKEEFDPVVKVREVIKIYDSVNVRSSCEIEMNRYYETAMNNLNQLSLSEEKKAPLFSFSEALFNREQ